MFKNLFCNSLVLKFNLIFGCFDIFLFLIFNVYYIWLWLINNTVLIWSFKQAADTQIISDYVRYFLHQHTLVFFFLNLLLFLSAKNILHDYQSTIHYTFLIYLLLLIIRIQQGQPATVKVASNLIRLLSYQNKVIYLLIQIIFLILRSFGSIISATYVNIVIIFSTFIFCKNIRLGFRRWRSIQTSFYSCCFPRDFEND